MSDLDYAKGSIEGCPGKYDSENVICKECGRAEDCMIEVREKLASDPKAMGSYMAEAIKAAQAAFKESMDKENPLSSIPGMVAMTPLVKLSDPAVVDSFMKLVKLFFDKMVEYRIEKSDGGKLNPDSFIQLLKVYIQSPIFMYHNTDPPEEVE